MSKINIEVKLEENKKELINLKTQAILIDNTIKYKDNTATNILEIEKLILKRKTQEYENIIDFENNIIIYKYNSNELKIEIITKNIIKTKNKIKIKYEIPGTKTTYNYKITME